MTHGVRGVVTKDTNMRIPHTVQDGDVNRLRGSNVERYMLSEKKQRCGSTL